MSSIQFLVGYQQIRRARIGEVSTDMRRLQRASDVLAFTGFGS